jgi:hypothetical protein
MSQSRNACNRIGAVILFFSALFLASTPGAAPSWQDQDHPFSADLSIYKFGRAGAVHLQKVVRTPQSWSFFTEESPQGCTEVGIPLIKEITLHHQVRSFNEPSLPFVTSKVSAYLFNSVLIL